jgi:hypothetical protein
LWFSYGFSLTGVFGTIFYQYMYDMAKSTPTFLVFIGVSGISFFVLMIYMSMKVIRTAKQLQKSNFHAKRTREISYMTRNASPFRNQRIKVKKHFPKRAVERLGEPFKE